MPGNENLAVPVVPQGGVAILVSDGVDVIDQQVQEVGAPDQGIGQAPAEEAPELDDVATLKKQYEELSSRFAAQEAEVRKVQGTKDAEVARAKAAAFQADQARKELEQRTAYERQQYQQWQGEVEKQREQEWQQWWAAASPEDRQAETQRLQGEYLQGLERRNQVLEMGQQATSKGVPADIVSDAIQRYGTPEAVAYAVQNWVQQEAVRQQQLEMGPFWKGFQDYREKKKAGLLPPKPQKAGPPPRAPGNPPAPAAQQGDLPNVVAPPTALGAQVSDVNQAFKAAYRRGDVPEMTRLRQQMKEMNRGVDLSDQF